MSSIRWNITVSPDTDQSLRMFLASQGGGRTGDLSKFIEEAACTHVFEPTAAQAKAANAHVSEPEMVAIINEAVTWAHDPC